METVAQLAVDFIAEYGILAAIVFALIWGADRRGKQQAAIMQGMIENQKRESEQQSEILGVLKAEVSSRRDITTSIENMKQGTEDALKTSTESVNNMTSEVGKILKEISAMRSDIHQLARSVDDATTELKNTVISKTSEYENRMKQLEASVKDMQPADIPKVLHPISKAKPGVPVTPKPENDEPKEKTE